MMELNRSLLLARRTRDQPSGVNRATWLPSNDQEGFMTAGSHGSRTAQTDTE